ncbi:hypothetical protein DFH07DRAFT_986648, partial [Mycena maculata]
GGNPSNSSFRHIDKKQKLDSDSNSDSDSETHWNPDDVYKQDIVSDIALEIGLRQRLLETIESRISWALILQESLMNDESTGPQLLDFKDVALGALEALEAPAQILFARDEPAPPVDTRRPSMSKKLRKKPTVRAQPAKKSGKFLYIHLVNSTAPSILRCPVCMRTDFSSLQGLFNHARGTHSLGWTSHDECVRHCACELEKMQGGAVDFTYLDAGVEVGTSGVLPGLRSLFQRAVDEDEDPDLDGEMALSRTLGYHIDTPALASFLGREPVRRGVMVWDPDAVVDIDGLEDEKPRAKPRWRMPFSHRNIFKDVAMVAPASSLVPAPPEAGSPAPSLTGIPNGLPKANSRFHIVTRIVVVDRSLWLPPDQRLGSDTHKWMISVDAPSYTHHITTVLQSLSVISPTGPLITTAPPFAVIGTADRPFLARLELAFSSTGGGREPQKIVLDHWVELDCMQSPSVAQGEEQIVDIELDRRTPFLPVQSGYVPTNSRALWDMDLEKRRHTLIKIANDVTPLEAHGRGWPTVLKKLVERFPLTLQDIKGGKPPSPALPYKLAANPSQFASLVMGRKKAIEWGRATAIRDAYSDAVLGGLTEDVTRLTTADIFSWLHTNGYFPRGVETIKKEQDLQTLKTGFCRICGLAYRLHAIVSDPHQGSVKSESRSNLTPNNIGEASACHITPTEWQMKRMPMIDVSRLLPRRHRATSLAPSRMIVPLNAPLAAQAYQRPEARVRDGNWDTRAPALLAVTDPTLISAVRDLVLALKLPSLNSSSPTSTELPKFPIDPALSPAEIQADIAPYAMLSLLTRQFVRALVKTGLDVTTRDRQRAMVQIDGRARRLPGVAELFSDRERRMLTQSHILRGVVTRGWNDELGTALMGCLARSGVPLLQQRWVGPGEALGSIGIDVGQGQVSVKTEPDAGISSEKKIGAQTV